MHAKTDSLRHGEYAPPVPDPSLPVLVTWRSQASDQQPSKADLEAYSDNPEWLSFDSSRQHFDAALQEACRRYPGHQLILLRQDIELPDKLLQRLAFWRQQAPDIDAIAVLSNWRAGFNPFGLAGQLPEPPLDAALDALVANTSQRRLYGVSQWPQHLVWISARAAQRLSELDRSIADSLPERVGIRMLLADDIFARCHSQTLFSPTPDYDWDMPPAFPAEYRQGVLQQLVADEVWSLPRIDPGNQPVLLHITHSWGGGVARWVKDYCEHDHIHTHLVLQSRGFWKNKQYGTQLSLHQGCPDGPQLAGWWLTPGIYSTEIRNQQYQEVLDTIQRLYQVSRVVVSSLIGHSLDALRCPLPTIQVLHDFYPAWPLLSVAPGTDPDQIDLRRSLAETSASECEFTDRDSRDWQVLTRSWLYHLRHPRVRLIAPTQAARQQLLAICPDAERIEIDIIGHGLRAWEDIPPTSIDSQRPPAEMIRVLVLGRLQLGKGRDLLLQALPQLDQQIHITALGCGREGRQLLGHRNVDVIMQYDWQQLPQLIGRIQPDVALLLSTVPETFSYTLSELQALHVPVIATRNGSFTERVEHGANGLLIEPTSTALVQTLTGLVNNRIVLKQLQQRVQALQPVSMPQMLADYETVWQSIHEPSRPLASAASKNDLANAQLLNQTRLSDWRGRELEQRTARLQAAYQELGARLKQLRAQGRDLQQLRAERQQLKQALSSLTGRMHQLNLQFNNQQQQLRQTLNHLQHLQARLDTVLDSRSWRLTKPLRLSNRLLYNLKRFGAFNPLRWPRLLNKLIQRLQRQGLSSTLRSLQEVPESVASHHTLSTDMPTEPVAWPPVATGTALAHTHIVLLRQQRPAALAALLNHLLDAVAQQPAQVHILAADQPGPQQQALSEYLDSCEGLHVYASPKALSKALKQAYYAAQIDQLLVAQGPLLSSANSLRALLRSAVHRPAAMLVGGLETSLDESPRHPLESYSRTAAALNPALLLLRASALDGLLESSFPKQPLAELLPSVTELLQRYDGQVWQQYNARYHILGDHPEAVDLPVPTDADRPAILIVDAWVPMPDKDSGSLRMTNLLNLLVMDGWHVVFCPFNLRHEGHYTEQLQSLGVEVWYAPYLSSFTEFLSTYGQQFQSVILSRHEVAAQLLKPVRRYCPDARLIFDTVDLHYLREQREADLADSLQLQRIAEQTRQQELAIMRQSDLTLVVSAAEQSLLAEEVPDCQVEVLSNIHATHGRRKEFPNRQDCLFVGGFQHPPNLDAVRWLCNDIWPLVQLQLPEARLHIIGSKMPAELTALASEHVLVHGYVEDLDSFHDNCRVSLAPLRYGAGVKGKINSAMSFGLPVVATECAVEGMNMQHEQQVLIADDSEAFAAAVVRLYTDQELWNRLSEAGLDNVAEHFSIQAARQQLNKILKLE